MKFESLKSEGMKHEYNICISGEDIESAIVAKINEKAKTFKMQGFRPGKVPFNIVRSNVEHIVMKDALDDLIEEAMNSILKEIGASSFSTKPHYKFDEKYEKGGDLNVHVSFEVAPEFKIKPFDFKIDKIVPLITDENIKKETTSFIEIISQETFLDAPEGHALEIGDSARVSIRCYINGAYSKKDSRLVYVTLNKDAEENPIAKQLIGKRKGDSFEYNDEKQPKTSYTIFIKEVRAPFKNATIEKYTEMNGISVDEFNARLKEFLFYSAENDAFIYNKSVVLDNLMKQYEFDLPAHVVEHERSNVRAAALKEFEEEKAKAKKGGLEEPKLDENFEAEVDEVVKKRVLLGYVLNKIADEEGIKITIEDLRNAINKEIQNSRTPGVVSNYYSNNKDAVFYKKAELLEAAVINHVMSKVVANEVQKTPEEIAELLQTIFE